MLSIYESLFRALNKERVTYCLYKSLNFLEEDLGGLRGDIDVLVSEQCYEGFVECAREVGFKIVWRSQKWPVYLVGRDPATNKFVMIDLDVSFRFGPKPLRPHRIKVDWEQLEVANRDGVTVLSGADYFLLMFLMRVTSDIPKAVDFEEIKNHSIKLKKDDLLASQIFDVLPIERANASEALLADVSSAEGWSELKQKWQGIVVASLRSRESYPSLGKRAARLCLYFYNEYKRKFWRLLGASAYRVRARGALVALVGVDGAGKSSAVEALMSSAYYNFTGIRRVYFGFNEYRVPGVLKLNNVLSSVPVFKYIPRVMMALDRQLRIVPALYYKALGNLVVCDRYYYDDEISRKISIGRGTRLGWLRNLLKPRMLLRPDLALYLNVSPDVAYSRKQDYPYEVMLEVNRAYREYMAAQPEVVFINADEPQAAVQAKIFECVSRLEEVL